MIKRIFLWKEKKRDRLTPFRASISRIKVAMVEMKPMNRLKHMTATNAVLGTEKMNDAGYMRGIIAHLEHVTSRGVRGETNVGRLTRKETASTWGRGSFERWRTNQLEKPQKSGCTRYKPASSWAKNIQGTWHNDVTMWWRCKHVLTISHAKLVSQ